ncbi:MAG TPA: hypothetical protein VKP60_05120 [Magnetospirillaceae bacterium]|nr:hypothetical protein [Magnetospirillaceae bacterium]
MREILNLAATLIEATNPPERPGASRAAVVVVASTVAALGALGTVVSLLAALWIYEEPILGEVGAPLVVAAVLAAASLIAAVILHSKHTPPPAPPPGLPALGALSSGLQGLMRSNKFLVLLGALMVGLAAGEGHRH